METITLANPQPRIRLLVAAILVVAIVALALVVGMHLTAGHAAAGRPGLSGLTGNDFPVCKPGWHC